MSIDKLWENYYGWTPYQYSMNNPISALDYNSNQVKHASVVIGYENGELKVGQVRQAGAAKSEQVTIGTSIKTGDDDIQHLQVWRK